MKSLMLCGILLFGCGTPSTTINTDQVYSEIDKKAQVEMQLLRNQVLSLQGTITMLNNFVASDFSSCTRALPPFEQKICQIAQTANGELLIKFKGQMGQWLKTLSDAYYGPDCYDTVGASCPATSSMLGRMSTVESDIATLEASQGANDSAISTLQGQVSTLQSDMTSVTGRVTALENRLNDFDGSGSTIEVVIAGIDSDLTALTTTVSGIDTRLIVAEGKISGLESDVGILDGRVDDMEEALDPSSYFNVFDVCTGVPQYTRPESILVTGDWSKVVSYSSIDKDNEGLSTVFEGDGSIFTNTTLSPKDCNFKIYDLGVGNGLDVCWKNTQRNPNEAALDAVCDPNNDEDPADKLAACTCLR